MRWFEITALTVIGALFGGAFFVIGIQVDIDEAYHDTVPDLTGFFTMLLIVGFGAATTLYIIWIRPACRFWLSLAAYVSCALYAFGLAYAGSAVATAYIASPESDRALLAAYALHSNIITAGLVLSQIAATAFAIIAVLARFLPKLFTKR